jgi:hypothetical protein
MDDTVIIAHIGRAPQPNPAYLCTYLRMLVSSLVTIGNFRLHMVDEMVQSLAYY